MQNNNTNRWKGKMHKRGMIYENKMRYKDCTEQNAQSENYNYCFMYKKKGNEKDEEGKVIKDFNDIENDLKKYTVGKKFKAENSRYIELFDKGFVRRQRGNS
ncbi:MAG: hypothetical protein ACLS9A_10000 [Clostridia bacterium]